MKPALRTPEFMILLATCLSTGALWVFGEVYEIFAGDGSRSIDTGILLAFRSSSDRADPIGPQWVEELARDITALGGLGVLTLVVAASVLFLLMAKKGRAGAMVLATIAGGSAVTESLKSVFGRPRPDLVLQEVYVYTASFPSGHAAMSAVIYLTLGALLARSLPTFTLKTYVMLVCAAITLLVGLSRVYLGVHWPSDVLAGWSLGAGWSLLCWAGAEWLGKKGRKGDLD